METKDLICSINNFEANIVFDKNRSYREIANGQSPFFFTPVEKANAKDTKNQKIKMNLQVQQRQYISWILLLKKLRNCLSWMTLVFMSTHVK